jgi:hypothetical protein
MKRRFPPDLFVVVLGPFIVFGIALGLGSLIFHASHFAGSWAAYIVVAAALVALLSLLFFRSRPRQ